MSNSDLLKSVKFAVEFCVCFPFFLTVMETYPLL